MCVGREQVVLKSFAGTSISLEVNLMDTVLALKSRVLQVEGTPVDQQRLVFAGEQLLDPVTLDKYGIQQGSILHLLLQLRAVTGERERAATIVLELEMQMTMQAIASNSSMKHYRRCVPTSVGINSEESNDEVSLQDGSSFTMWEVPRGTLITATYVDASPFGSASDVASVSRKGVLEVTPRVLGMGRSMHITVTDADLNQNASLTELASVSVFSSWEDERLEHVVLTERGIDSEVFTGMLRTVSNGYPSPACGGSSSRCTEPLSSFGPALHTRPGDDVYISYLDVRCSRHASR
jgi:hypothetical protein